MDGAMEGIGMEACLALISSVHARVGLPCHPAHAVAKAGLIGLGRQLATEYGPRLRVNAAVASAVTFLVSDDASYITGAALLAGGGWSAGRECR
jgi:NAD(P)-dependent dehydrogenase (short-subunit alcohol dehydrogenase family)